MNERQILSKIKLKLLQQKVFCLTIFDGLDHAPRPFDLAACYHGLFFGIEGKILKGYKSLNPKIFSDHQNQNLNNVIFNEGRAMAWIIIRIINVEYRIISFDWEFLRLRFLEGSIKKKELEKYPYQKISKKRDLDLDLLFRKFKKD